MTWVRWVTTNMCLVKRQRRLCFRELKEFDGNKRSQQQVTATCVIDLRIEVWISNKQVYVPRRMPGHAL